MTPVRFEGQIPEIERVRLGLWSLDQALAQKDSLGIPVRIIVELYGKWHVGKSSLAYYIAGRAAPKGKIYVADLEGTADKEYVISAVAQSGFDGTVKSVDYQNTESKKARDPKKKFRTHEDMMQELADALFDDSVTAGVLDSVGGVFPEMEAAGDIADQFVGRRAQDVAKFTRRATFWLRVAEAPKILIAVNHTQQIIGKHSQGGETTPGGNALKYAASVRLKMWREENFDDGTFLAKVKVEKLRYGGASTDRLGLVCIVPGLGVSPELTALFDCEALGFVERGQTVKLHQYNKKTKKEEVRPMGRIGLLIDAAKAGDVGKLRAFRTRIQDYEEDGK